MAVETLIADAESALVTLIRYGLARRYTVANVAALAAMQPSVLSDHALAYVAAAAKVYEWLQTSTATANGTSIVATTAQLSRGRWVVVDTAWTYGAGGVNLASKQSGYLLTTDAYSDAGDADQLIDVTLANIPAVLVTFEGSSPSSLSNIPGTYYRDDLSFSVIVLTSNLGGGVTATQGSPIADDAPGAYRVIGELRRLITSNTRNLASFIERAEIGDVRREFADLERRVECHSMKVTLRTSWFIEDEDLVDVAIQGQPQLVGPAKPFDAQNYVSTGCTIDDGTGLSRILAAGTSVIGGAVVASPSGAVVFAPDSDVYRDLDINGAWHLTDVPVGSDAPALAAGSLRVAFTRTSSTDVISDVQLCSFATDFGDAFDVT